MPRIETIQLPNGAAAGRVLTSDANGVGTWQAAAGGGGATVAAAAARSTEYGVTYNLTAGWNPLTLPTALTIEPSDAFTISGNSVTVKDAGWYDVDVSGLAMTGTADTLYVSLSTASYGVDGDIGNGGTSTPYGRTGASGVVKLPAGGKVYAWAYSGIASLAFHSLSFSIAKVGGPQGPKGDTGGNATVPMDTWHIVGTAGEPAFGSGWLSYGAGFEPVGFRKFPDGKIKLKGLAYSQPGGGAPVIFTLPAGYRPPLRVLSHGESSYTTDQKMRIDVAPAGDVTLAVSAPGSTFVSLDDIEFDTGSVTAMTTGPAGPPGTGLPVGMQIWGPYQSTATAALTPQTEGLVVVPHGRVFPDVTNVVVSGHLVDGSWSSQCGWRAAVDATNVTFSIRNNAPGGYPNAIAYMKFVLIQGA